MVNRPLLWKCGHPKTAANTVGRSKMSPGGQCRACRREYQRGAGGRAKSTAPESRGRPRASTAVARLTGNPKRRAEWQEPPAPPVRSAERAKCSNWCTRVPDLSCPYYSPNCRFYRQRLRRAQRGATPYPLPRPTESTPVDELADMLVFIQEHDPTLPGPRQSLEEVLAELRAARRRTAAASQS